MRDRNKRRKIKLGKVANFLREKGGSAHPRFSLEPQCSNASIRSLVAGALDFARMVRRRRLAPTSIGANSQNTTWGRTHGAGVFSGAIVGVPSRPLSIYFSTEDGMGYTHRALPKSRELYLFTVYQRGRRCGSPAQSRQLPRV